jgi:hypothetical protein
MRQEKCCKNDTKDYDVLPSTGSGSGVLTGSGSEVLTGSGIEDNIPGP